MGMLFERLGLMKVNKPTTFHVEPRYYSESKERINSMNARHTITEDDSDEHVAAVIKERMRQSVSSQWSFQADKQKQSRTSNRRVALILIILLLGVIYLWQFMDDSKGPEVINIDNIEQSHE